MTTTEPEELAFPVPATEYNDRYPGMTLRDYFAAKAMHAAIVACDVLGGESYRRLVSASKAARKSPEQQIALEAYRMAAAMMTERKTKGAA